MGTFIMPDGSRYSLPGIDDPVSATEAMKSHPVLKGNIPDGARFVAGDAVAEAPAQEQPFAKTKRIFPVTPDVEGALPPEPTPISTIPKEVARLGAQMAVGIPTALSGNIPAAAASATLAGIGVDAAYGDMATPKEYAGEAAFQVAIPVAGSVAWKYGKPYVQKAMNKAAVRLYQSGAKFLPSLGQETRDEITKVALTEKILPQRQQSLVDLAAKINVIDDAMEGAFQARNSVDGIPTQGIKEAKDRMIAYYRENSLLGPSIANGLQKQLKYVDDLPAYLTPARALEMRKNVNRDLRGFMKRWNTAGAVPAETSMDMTLSKMRVELNNALYEHYPELRELGKREASYIMLQDHLERTLNRLQNRDIIPLSAIIAGSAMGGITGGITGDWKTGGSSGLGTALLIAMAGSPNMKARVAFALARGGALGKATPSTLSLLNLTRERAVTLEARMKALPYPRTMGTGKPDISGPVKGGQEVIQGETTDAPYEKLWRQYAIKYDTRDMGQFDIIPK